jgi:carboxymethylenebutenolidase
MLTIEKVTFASASGEAAGYLALPAAAKAPAVVLVQEWWGVNAHIQSVLGRLAEAGFVALAPDLYHGVVATDAGEAGKLMGSLDWGRALAELGGAVEYLRGHARSNGKVGMLGFCMGGALTFKSATVVPGLGAAVPFYGVPDPSTDYATVTAPVLAHFATRDEWAKPEAAKAIQAGMAARGQSMRLEIYEADHAFCNDTRPEVYSPDNAKLAWTRSVEFLHHHLG